MFIITTKNVLRLSALCVVLFITMVTITQAAGENLWSHKTNVGLLSYGPYKSIEVTNYGVYSLALRKNSFSPSSPTSGIEVHMRNLDNTAGWTRFIPVVVSFEQPSPVITADQTGVYVVVKKLSNFTYSNPAMGVISITKLSPVDGSVIAIREYPASLYAPVWAAAVDSQGLYVITNQYTSGSPSFGFGQQGCINVNNLSGSRWLVQKWDKNLSGAAPLWQYTSQESGGTHGDYFVNSVAINSNSIFVGGAKMNLSCTSIAYQSRLESINKNTGTRNWLWLGPVGSGRINTITADDTSLFVTTHRPDLSPRTSRIEERSVANGAVIWTRPFSNYITALLLNNDNSLSLAYIPASAYIGGKTEMYLQNVNSTDGLQIGTTTVSTYVNVWDYHNIYYDNDMVMADTVKLGSDNSMYVAGSSGSTTNYMSDLSKEYTILKKYLAFGSQNNSPTTPILSGPTSGTINTSYLFSAISTDPENDTIRYGFDWNRDNTVDTWAPTSGYVVSGQSQSTSRLWTVVGNQQFQVLAEDSFGNKSSWAQYATLVSVNPRLLICPNTLSIGVGTISSLEARYWANPATLPVCATNGYTNVTNTATWISSTPSIASVSNSGTRGVVTGLSSGNTSVSATYSGLVSAVPVNVAAAPTVITVKIIPQFKLVRSRTVVNLRVAITSNVNLICTIRGIEGSVASFTHIGSALEVNYNQFQTRPLQSALQVSLNCYNALNTAETAEDSIKIEVIPTMQEV